ncbi:hypothetical protein LTR91_014812 [Friedmanniomyces endolithicus]|uniref:Uncharacterized protein n=1 Tax=Friedmanniomyces endolithicus TaxID=329885 RepID=A0AAN6KB30_9PEZI|nr:hypothetical protein LTR94_006547 [Friedmanniomyces endolithicus]KAK0778770.1 hypothetical protein LTR59_013381 [Friedmanniomyces endolithicus]KAK0798887.1 hypothetical protein LTR38_007693 [Friedmanniomyces endolithicus]KAK0805778.1 hypothetical protein LTR75_007240 [Friedmanniomyces endolithicus]KAK0863496.1 hypothetical protein LTS02_006572 [Friedmanniomyces endolithicus]
MDLITQLHCRNAALETELRLVKEQLAQAHVNTNYLLSTFTSQQKQQERITIGQLQARLDVILAENSALRSHTLVREHLGVGQSTQTSCAGPRRSQIHSLQSQLPSPLASSDEQNAASGNNGYFAQADDLLGYQAEDDIASDEVEVSPSQAPNTLVHVALCDTSSLLDTPLKQQIDLSQAAQRGVVDKRTGELSHTIDHADGTTSFVMLTPESPLLGLSGFTNPSPASQPPTRPRWGFTFSDRTYLLGQACWIEDMDDTEYASKWRDIARRRSKQTAAEWQEYYERTIRSDFHEQEAGKAEARRAKKAAGGDGDEHGDGEADETENARVATFAGSLETADDDTKIKPHESEEEIDIAQHDDTTEAVNEEAVKESSSENNSSSPVPIEAEAKFEDLRASRWAPKVMADRRECIPEVAPTDEAGTNRHFVELPTVEQYCAEQEPITKRLAAERETDQCGLSSTQANLKQEEQSDSRALGSDGVRDHRAPRRGYGGMGYSTHRGGYNNGPPCCHWPTNHPEVLHSNYAHDPSTLRTVMITNIHPGNTLADVLDKVYGGTILTATYLPLSEMRTKPAMQTDSVMVTFLYASDACVFANDCAKHFLFYWSEKWESPIKATVTHIQTPVRIPGHVPGIQQIRNDGLSRVIYLRDGGDTEPEGIMSAVLSVLAPRSARSYQYAKYPLRMGRNRDGVLFFEFATVEDAVIVKQTMDGVRFNFEHLGSGYLEDPCEKRERAEPYVYPDSVATSVSDDQEDDEEGSVVIGASEYSAEKRQSSVATPGATDEIVASEQPQIRMILVPDTIPRTVWSLTGDIEAAKAFMTSATRARGQRRAVPEATPTGL